MKLVVGYGGIMGRSCMRSMELIYDQSTLCAVMKILKP